MSDGKKRIGKTMFSAGSTVLVFVILVVVMATVTGLIYGTWF